MLYYVINALQAAQMLSALISLEAYVDDGHNYNSTYLTSGDVRVSNLTCYFNNRNCPRFATVLHTLAHSYGETILASECGTYKEVGDIPKLNYDYKYFCREDRREFALRFNEYNPNDTQKAYPYFTHRTITASSGGCLEYNQVGNVEDKGGLSNFTYSNGSTSGSIVIPNAKLGREGTTYIYRGINPPAGNVVYACGPRCLLMWAYKNVGGSNKPIFYECPITISKVSNASRPEHDIPDAVARLAAASIALQGQWSGTLKHEVFTQYQFYAGG